MSRLCFVNANVFCWSCCWTYCILCWCCKIQVVKFYQLRCRRLLNTVLFGAFLSFHIWIKLLVLSQSLGLLLVIQVMLPGLFHRKDLLQSFSAFIVVFVGIIQNTGCLCCKIFFVCRNFFYTIGTNLKFKFKSSQTTAQL